MALRKVVFVSRQDAEDKYGSMNWAVISISDPFHYPAMLKSGWHDVLRLEFHDIEEESKPRILFSVQDAHSIVVFVDQVNACECDGILVHCKAGISRSAAIAKWIAKKYHLPFNHNYSQYNRHMYTTLCQVANTGGRR